MKSYTFRLIVVCTVGMLPLLGYSGYASAAIESANVSSADVGSIKGTVTGQRSKAALGGVNIQIINSNGFIKYAVSQKDGTFTVPQLPVGQYNLKIEKLPAKSVQVAMSPPDTEVDFQVPERGYLVFSGMSKKQKIILGVIGLAALGVGIYLLVDSSSSHDSP